MLNFHLSLKFFSKPPPSFQFEEVLLTRGTKTWAMISGICGFKSDLSPPLSVPLWRLCAMNTSVVNTSATTQTGFAEEKKVGLPWIPQAFVQVLLSKQEQQHFSFGA